jgi:3-hydroxymyristoyl/3-hydroxydecanoyl-(acyl carrier protein) dehydratase
MNRTLEFPEGSACFAGHFPGRPILPGVTLLAQAADALRAAGENRPLAGIGFARLRQPVLPGMRIALDARAAAAGAWRIDLRDGNALVANAALAFGDLPAAPRGTLPAAAREAIPAFDSLLPHRPPMRFVTAVLETAATGVSCAAIVPRDCPLVRQGVAPALAVIEAAAQAAATWEALARTRTGGVAEPRQGYLVALRDVELFARHVAADAELVATVRLDAAALPLTHYAFDVSAEGAVVARGSISTFLAAAAR